ncbi:MAG: hypothetical protein KJ970_07175 [Candidatus Eisenbacteria bacterium]|uniref:Radical SAM core domain-containing protein n=1 Tax=Eiseniibacteriota bacterium TaxID=2212470 RepID=A0A948RTF9_UNCEI|nr:hypothetical protein [Candidatus Eisenbacteria bacterium]MBU1950239.1 hypothetical protein [Candidatus Eisenbacteria bacterium]MBU2690695.1 hypothetical protein [Candidatus Eisenbacteria bacterium]
METDVRHNPGLLKLDLYCKGIRMDESCFIEKDGGRSIMRTRAGLGSGLEAVLPGDLWTNIPVAETFAKSSPYILYRENDTYVIRRDGDNELISPIRLSPRPNWYDKRTSTGKLMTKIGSLQGTYLGIYPSKVCEYWTEKPKTNCKFCSVGLNLGVDDADEKSVREVMEVIWAAREESNITYIDFNTGHYSGHTFLDILEPYIVEIKKQTGLLIGIQTPPHPDMSRFDHMREIGVNRVSFCFEIWDPKRFEEVCPGKAREYGLKGYLDAVEYCAKMGKGGVSFDPWVSNGEIIVGLEEPKSSIKAIEWITSVGAIPTVCVFRPLIGTDYADVAPPKTEDMVPIFRRLYETCMDNNLPIGVAPNIHVSLVMLPEEGKWLVDKPGKYKLKEMKLKTLSKIYSAGYYRTLNKKLKDWKASKGEAS